MYCYVLLIRISYCYSNCYGHRPGQCLIAPGKFKGFFQRDDNRAKCGVSSAPRAAVGRASEVGKTIMCKRSGTIRALEQKTPIMEM